MIRDYMKKSLTDFEKLIDYVEEKLNIEFCEVLNEKDAVDEAEETVDEDFECVRGFVGDENIRIILGHWTGKGDKKGFIYAICYPEEPVYQGPIDSWREVAEKAVKHVEKYVLGEK